MQKYWRVWAAGLLMTVAPSAARAALPAEGSDAAVKAMPDATEVRVAARGYPVVSLARTSHRGWKEASAIVNVPQSVRLAWHVDGAGEALLRARDAWNPRAPWRELGRWGRGSRQPGKGELQLRVEAPTLLWLRVRAARFPASGIASLRADYVRHTVAVLRGAPGATRRPVLIAEGYDPYNEQDWNDPGWQEDPTLARLVGAGRARYGLDPWLLDWGDAGAPLEEQADDFADLARQLRQWNGGPRGTVAVGISMGAISLRYALARAADRKEDLGVREYVSINGPHRGAWVNPKLTRFLLKTSAKERLEGEEELSETALLRRGLTSPAAQELLIGGSRHDAFYADLRSRGAGGYDPSIPRVAFSSGSLVNEGTDLAELTSGKRQVVHRVLVRPLWLPFWTTFHKTRREFRYGAFPGELIPSSLRRPVREHVRFLGIFRFDFRARWETIPTFIPTHSALDFPDDLEGGPERYRYTRWRESSFPRMFVSRGRNLPHDETAVEWIDPRTGRGAADGRNAVLEEIARSYTAGG